jgi:hypothetical protein
MIAGSEIHYKPLVTEEIEVPQLREIHAGAMCYLDIRRDMHPTVVFDFLKKFPLWRLFSPASKSYRMAIPLLE